MVLAMNRLPFLGAKWLLSASASALRKGVRVDEVPKHLPLKRVERHDDKVEHFLPYICAGVNVCFYDTRGAALFSFLLLMPRFVAYSLHRIVVTLDRHSVTSQLRFFLPDWEKDHERLEVDLSPASPRSV